MKLMRLGEPGRERPAVLLEPGVYADIAHEVEDFGEAFFGSSVLQRLRDLADGGALASRKQPLDGQRVGAPVPRPHQIICVGLNYRDHAAESGMAIPDEPILFTKSPNTLVGPEDGILPPRGATKLDWEVELGIVIGRRTSYLDTPEEAAGAIAGWMVVNDVSERSFQMERGGQWLKGKSAATFNPAGPWLVTPEEVPDVKGLHLWLDHNGIRRQSGTTADMIFDPYVIVHHISQFMTLEPGDIINTGTPAGVGMGFDPPVWLQPGDVLELGIEGLGTQRQRVLEGG